MTRAAVRVESAIDFGADPILRVRHWQPRVDDPCGVGRSGQPGGIAGMAGASAALTRIARSFACGLGHAQCAAPAQAENSEADQQSVQTGCISQKRGLGFAYGSDARAGHPECAGHCHGSGGAARPIGLVWQARDLLSRDPISWTVRQMTLLVVLALGGWRRNRRSPRPVQRR